MRTCWIPVKFNVKWLGKMPAKITVNDRFFERWSDNMAYVCGFFAADGYLTLKKSGQKYWCIKITDKSLVYRIRRAVGSRHKIGVVPGDGRKQNQYRLQIGSSEMCNDLESIGFRDNKTKSMALPNVPIKYLPHFVRGYFDGDGNVWVGYVHKNRKRPLFVIQTTFTSCSFDFLSLLRQTLSEEIGVTGSLIKGKSGYFRLSYSINGSLKLRNFMYNHGQYEKSGLFLKRKKVVFDRFIRLRP